MTAKRCLAYRHVQFEDLGAFGPVIEAAGYHTRYHDAGVGRFDVEVAFAADLLVVLGGPIAAHDGHRYPFLDDEVEAIRRRVTSRRPTLGVCLGMQLITAALGGNVGAGPAKEIGWGPIELTDAGARSVLAPLAGTPVLHWHGDLAAVPEGAERLAETELCHNQAYAIDQWLLGLQFHVEADPTHIEQWLIGHSFELAEAGVDPERIRQDTVRFGDETAAIGARVLGDWLKGLGNGVSRLG